MSIRTILQATGVVIVLIALGFLVHITWHVGEPFQHWLGVHTGTLNEPGGYYGFWSGFGSDLGEMTLVAALFAVFRKHNCHVKGCWRVGKHTVDGSPWCNKHHIQARQMVADTGSAHGVTTNGTALIDNTTIDTDIITDDHEDEHEARVFGFRCE